MFNMSQVKTSRPALYFLYKDVCLRLPLLLSLCTCSISQILSSVFLQTGWVYFSAPALISFVSLSVCLFGVTCFKVAPQFAHSSSQTLSDWRDNPDTDFKCPPDQTNVKSMQIPARGFMKRPMHAVTWVLCLETWKLYPLQVFFEYLVTKGWCHAAGISSFLGQIRFIRSSKFIPKAQNRSGPQISQLV